MEHFNYPYPTSPPPPRPKAPTKERTMKILYKITFSPSAQEQFRRDFNTPQYATNGTELDTIVHNLMGQIIGTIESMNFESAKELIKIEFIQG